MKGKVAIVTGGASGFGKAIATTFQKEGGSVVITDLSEDTGSAVAKEIGGTFVRADVTKRDDWEKVLKETLDSYGKLDVVINNAGTTYANKVSRNAFCKVWALWLPKQRLMSLRSQQKLLPMKTMI